MNNQKRYYTKGFNKFLVTAFALLVSICLSFVPFVKNDQTTDVFASIEGSGTSESPYLISSSADLTELAGYVNAGNTTYNSAYYKQTADIELNNETFIFEPDTGLVKMTDGTNTSFIGTGILGEEDGYDEFDTTASVKGTIYNYVITNAGGEGIEDDIYGYVAGTYAGTVDAWAPIGTSTNKFGGNFDGAGFTISGAYINGTSNYQGLFGYTSSTATLNLVNVEDSLIIGGIRVGGIVGVNTGLINKCFSDTIVLGDETVGGIAGQNGGANGKIYNTENAGTVLGGSVLGGIVGYNGGTINNCYNMIKENDGLTNMVYGTGEKIGGIVGQNTAVVNNSYSSVSVVGGGCYVGAVAGYNGDAGSQVNYSYYCKTFPIQDGDLTTQNGIGNETLGASTADISGVTNSFRISDGELDNSVTLNLLEYYTLIDALNVWRGMQVTPTNYLSWESITIVGGTYEGTYSVYGSLTLTYNANGGTGSVADAEYLSGSTATVQGIGEVIKTGYTFAGWNTEADGTGTGYLENATMEITNDVTLYAQWTLNAPTVGSVTGCSIGYDGSSRNISVGASHVLSTTYPLTYQWYKGGTETGNLIADATSTTYSVKNVADSGSYYCKVSISDGTTTKTTTSSVVTVIIDKASLLYGIGAVTATYDGNAHYLNINASGFKGDESMSTVGTITYSSTGEAGSYSSTLIGATNVSQGAVTVFYKATFDNYTDFSDSQTVTIIAKSLTVAWVGEAVGDFSYVYTGSVICPTASVTTGVGEETLALTVTGGQTVYSADAYTATAEMTTANTNYTLTSTTQTYYITKSTLEDTTLDVSAVYDGSAHHITVTATGFKGSDTIALATLTYCTTIDGTYSSDVINQTNVVTGYAVYYKATFANYADFSAPAEITITPKELTVVWLGESGSTTDFSYVYTGAYICPTASVTTGVGTETVNIDEAGGEINVGASITALASMEANANYTLTGTTKVFSITKATLTDTTADVSEIYNGTARSITVSASGFVKEADTIALATLTYCTIIDGNYLSDVISQTNVVAGYIVHYIATFANYETFTGYATITITPAVLTYTAANISPVARDHTGNTLIWTDAYIVEPANTTISAITTIDGQNYVDKGNPTIKVTLEADDNHTFETIAGDTKEFTITLSILQATNTWSSPLVIAGWTYNGTANTPSAVATFGTVTYSYSATEGGTYTETIPSTNAGTYYVKATVIGNDNYTGITTTRSFVIAKIKLDEPTVTATYTYTGGSQTVVCDYDNTKLTLNTEISTTSATDAGSYFLYFTIADATNYEWNTGSDGSVTWTIAKAKLNEPTITGTYTYTGVLQNVDYSSGFDGSTMSVTGNVGGTNAGNYNLTFTLTNTTDYEWNAGSDGLVAWSIAKATYDMTGITFADSTLTYDGNARSLAITGTLPDGVTVAYANNSNTNAGIYTVTASFTGDTTNHNTISDMSATLTISAKELTVAWFGDASSTEDFRYSYTGLSICPTGSVTTNVGTETVGLTITGGQTVYSATAYTATATMTTPNTNYTLLGTTKEFYIDKVTLSNTTGPVSVPFDNVEHFLTVSATGFVNSETIALATLTYSATGIDGSYSSTPIGATNVSDTKTVYYKATFANYADISSFALITITVVSISTYDSTSITASSKVYTGSALSWEIADFTAPTYTTVTAVAVIDGQNYTNVGSPSITVTLTADGNHTFSGSAGDTKSIVKTLSITQATNTWTTTLSITGWTYNGTVNTPTSAATFGTPSYTYAAIEGGVYNLTMTSTTTAWTYWVKATVAGTTNYAELISTTSFTIAKAGLDEPTVTGTYIYTGNISTVGYSGYNASTMGIDADSQGTGINAGDYTLHFTLDDSANYEWNGDGDGYVSWTIAKATYNMSGISLSNRTVTYDASAYGINIAGTLPEGVTVSYTNNGKTSAGVYTITAAFSGNVNYNTISDMTATLTITPATLTYTSANITPVAKTYTGVRLTWSTGNVTAPANTTVTGIETSDEEDYTNAGSPTMTVTLTAGANYTFDGTAGDTEDFVVTLTINKATLAENTAEVSVTYDGTAHHISVSATGFVVVETVSETIALATLTYCATTDGDYTSSNIEQTNVVSNYEVFFKATFDNYNDFAGSATITISAKSLAVAWLGEIDSTTDFSYVYSGSVICPTASVETGVTGETLTLIVVGGETNYSESAYTATASTANTNYTLTNTTHTYSITKAILTDATLAVTATYDGSAHYITVALTGFKGTDDISEGAITYCATSNGTYVSENIGVTTVAESKTVFFQVSFDNYIGILSSAVITINPVVLDYDDEDIIVADRTYTGVAQTWVVGDFTAPTNTTVALATIIAEEDYTNAGSPTITVRLTSGANYTFLTTAGDTKDFVVTLTIDKATLTDTTADVTATYNSLAQKITVSASGWAIIADTIALATINYSLTAVGGYSSDEIEVTNVADSKTVYFIATFDNYNDLTGSAIITINPASLTAYTASFITGTTSKIYTGSAISWLTTDFTAPTYTTVTAVAVIAEQNYTNVGSPSITVTLTADGNHSLNGNTTAGDTKSIVKTLSITQATNTWSTALSITGWTYGEEANDPTAVATFGSPTFTYSASELTGYSSTVPTTAGTYYVKATVTGTDDYTGLESTVSFTIAKAKLDEPNASLTHTYTGSSITVSYTGFDSDTMTVSGDESATNAGSYALSFTLKDTVNYEWNTGSNGSVAWIISKATYNMSAISFASTEVTYNGTLRSIAITGTLPNGVSVSYEGAGTTVGSYVITASFTGDSANYNAIADRFALLTIIKATYDMSEVSFANRTVIYDGLVKTMAISGTLPNGVSVSYANNGKTNAGVYSVSALFAGNSNYNLISSLVATLTISKATYDMSDIGFVGRTVVYDGSSQSIAITGTLPNGVSVSYEGSGTNVGQYIITASFTVNATNYNLVSAETALLTISKADYDMSEVVFEDETIVYDGEAHSIEISGTLPDGVSTPVYTNNGKTRPGEYEIVVSFTLEDSVNYNPVTLLATLIINQPLLEQETDEDEISITNPEGFDPDEEVVIVRTESEEFNEALTSSESISQTYDVSLLINEVEQTEFSGTYTIKIAYQRPSGVSSVKVLTLLDGEIVEEVATYSNGFLSFEVDELGEFAIVEEQEQSSVWLIVLLSVIGGLVIVVGSFYVFLFKKKGKTTKAKTSKKEKQKKLSLFSRRKITSN